MSSEQQQITADNVINGVSVAPTSGKYMDITNPADNTVIGKVAMSEAADVETAVVAAEKALIGWQAVTVKTRTQMLFRFWHIVQENMAELVELVVREHGKTEGEAVGSIKKGLETVEWACALPQLCVGERLEVSRGVTCHSVREPMGVCASIVPFNFPIMVPMWTLPICIAMGNAYILKPSEKVPLTMLRTIDFLHQAGCPPGIVQIVNGTRAAAEAICDHPRIKAVSFVGSTPVAKIVQERCRRVPGKRVLCLGGAKNHLVAYPDCNITMCAHDIINSFAGCAGQRCMAASVLLTIGEQPALLEAIRARASMITPGRSGATSIGPVIDRVSHTRIMKYIDDAEKGGATILVDGREWAKRDDDMCKTSGNWVGPTVIVHTNPKDAALQDEIFGPVLSILQVKDKEEAIAIENANPFGNAACIYTESGAAANWFSSRFSAGMIGVNIGVPVPREPFSFGGFNESKFGTYDITGKGAMQFFSQEKKVSTKWNQSQGADWMS